MTVSGVELCRRITGPGKRFFLPRHLLLWPECPAPAATPVSGATERGAQGRPEWAEGSAGPGGEAGVAGSGGR